VGLGYILTCYGFKTAQSHPIHVDYHQNEQALTCENISQYHQSAVVPSLSFYMLLSLRTLPLEFTIFQK
jgi:hypothetical protein